MSDLNAAIDSAEQIKATSGKLEAALHKMLYADGIGSLWVEAKSLLPGGWEITLEHNARTRDDGSIDTFYTATAMGDGYTADRHAELCDSFMEDTEIEALIKLVAALRKRQADAK